MTRLSCFIVLFESLTLGSMPLAIAHSITGHPRPEIERIADEVVSVFEYSSTETQYCTIEDIHDGRGYTAGRAGFTTGTGDLYDLILLYRAHNPNSPFRALEPLLKKRSEDESDSLDGLQSLPRIWGKVCNTPLFQRCQDELVDTLYKKPARWMLKAHGFKSRLAYVIFHDSILQHGYGPGPDSFLGILESMQSHPADERAFLQEFLEARINILQFSHDPHTREAWRESVDRAYALMKLLKKGNLDLKPPFQLEVWDTHWTIR